ncbi:MAG: hypothetical protein Q9217_001570 [Psora testacea]
MATNVLPPNPSLVAILLVVKTTSEPRLIFHYPPKPNEDNPRFEDIVKDGALDDTSTTSSEADGESSAEDSPLVMCPPVDQSNNGSSPDVEETGSASPEKKGPFQENAAELQWNDVFGYHASVLARTLSPPATSHKKRVEIALDGKVFLGQPAYAKSDGAWKKKVIKRSRRTSSKSSAPHPSMKGVGDLIGGSEGLEQDAVPNHSGDELQNSRVMEDGNVLAAAANAVSTVPTTDRDKYPKARLTMFHVSFVLDPPPLQYHVRVREMYDHVVKKFSKGLRWEQARSNYVAKEAAIIVSTIKRLKRASGNEPSLASLYRDVLTQSTLARAIATLYNSIVASKIAHITLTSTLSLSLQIPVQTAISKLPSSLSPQLPGVWLTSASSLPTEDDENSTAVQLGSHFGLLLLADLHTIIADINAAASPIASPLTHYLRASKPTKSFKQISQSSGIPLQDIQFLASHLIYWRRARAIPPLNQGDTYIVSPNADMRILVTATSAFAKAFPSLPPLPKMMSLLSSTPRAYSTLIPSVDHKEVYMQALAWLMRGGWVTQLRTFAWVRVPSRIMDSINVLNAVDGKHDMMLGRETNQEKHTIDKILHELPSQGVRSPTSSVDTTILASAKEVSQSIILSTPNPSSSTTLRYILGVSKYVGMTLGEESQAAWDTCVKYFDGKHAMESIAVSEGWKRKRTVELIAGWEELGVLIKSRHW